MVDDYNDFNNVTLADNGSNDKLLVDDHNDENAGILSDGGR